MKLFRKISIFLVIALVLCSVISINVFATEEAESVNEQAVTDTSNTSSKLDMNMSGADISMGERASYALQGTVTGMLMIFAVLGLLAGIVSLSKVVFYDIPNKKSEKSKSNETVISAEPQSTVDATDVVVANEENDTELAAVITAAIAAMLDTQEYANEFKSGFKVVSFKRVNTNGAWNKNN